VYKRQDILSATNAIEDGVQQVTSTITDDDAEPTVAFTTASQSSTDETGTMTITVRLSEISGKEVIVPFTVNGSSTAANGMDYTITASPITIAAGSATGDITITIVSDAVAEPDETIVVDIGVPTNATQGTPLTHTATIVGNLPPTGADNTISMYVNGTHAFAVSEFGFSDFNAEDTLQKVQVTALPGAGSLKLSGTAVVLNQEITAADIASGKLVFSPAADDVGSPYASFSFKVSDGKEYSAACTISINVIEAPVTDDSLNTGDTVSGSSTGVNDGDTIEDVTVEEGGEVTNQGTINDLTNAGTVTGGTVGGDSENSLSLIHI
jgi:hypothetical protein